MPSPLPGTSYIAILLPHGPTPPASLTRVPQEPGTASALKPEKPLKKSFLKNPPKKYQRKPPSSTRMQNKKPAAQTCQLIV